MEKVKFSIVTISYNQKDFLEEAMLSVINQDYDNYEYIVIDGGSTDGSQEIIKKYSDKLKYWISEPDNGPANALNKGFAQASGDYYYYINSDDLLLPGALKFMNNFINKNPGYDFYYGDGYMSYGTFDEKFNVYSDKFWLNGYRLGVVGMIQQTTFISKSIFKKINGFNEANKTHWDGELLADVAIADGTFKRYNYKTGFFRVHDQSLSGGMGNTKQYLLNIKEINKRIQEKFNYRDYPKFVLYLRKIFIDPKVVIGRSLVKLLNK